MAESRVESNLRAWRLETFAPKNKARRDNQFTSKPVYVTRPLFPRYIFAKFKLSDLMHNVYRSPYYNPASQSVSLSLIYKDERPFTLSNPN
ncbi:MAG: hypothetical protein H0X14_01445, partial [Acidobacteria bacterium]|nr:hypothetical protein [Acidobacteriota bacterium]